MISESLEAMPRGERKQPIWSTIPVPGLVTARRDSNSTRRQETLLQKRREDGEEEKKRRKDQEEAALILAKRWSQEDRKAREGSPSKRRSPSCSRSEASAGKSPISKRRRFSEECQQTRQQGRIKDTRQIEVVAGSTPSASSTARYHDRDIKREVDRDRRREDDRDRRRDDNRDRRRDDDRDRRRDDDRDRRRDDDREKRREGSRSERDRSDNHVDSHRDLGHDHRRDTSLSILESNQFSLNQPNAEVEQVAPESALLPALGSSPGGWATVDHVGTESAVQGTVTNKLPITKHVSAGRGTSAPCSKKTGKIAGVFGLSESDDDRESTRRELELATRIKREKKHIQGRTPLGSAAVQSGAVPLGPGREPADKGGVAGTGLLVAEVHMKYAQWKMSCKNRYVPMPEDLKRAVASVMGGKM